MPGHAAAKTGTPGQTHPPFGGKRPTRRQGIFPVLFPGKAGGKHPPLKSQFDGADRTSECRQPRNRTILPGHFSGGIPAAPVPARVDRSHQRGRHSKRIGGRRPHLPVPSQPRCMHSHQPVYSAKGRGLPMRSTIGIGRAPVHQLRGIRPYRRNARRPSDKRIHRG